MASPTTTTTTPAPEALRAVFAVALTLAAAGALWTLVWKPARRRLAGWVVALYICIVVYHVRDESLVRSQDTCIHVLCELDLVGFYGWAWLWIYVVSCMAYASATLTVRLTLTLAGAHILAALAALVALQHRPYEWIFFASSCALVVMALFHVVMLWRLQRAKTVYATRHAPVPTKTHPTRHLRGSAGSGSGSGSAVLLPTASALVVRVTDDPYERAALRSSPCTPCLPVWLFRFRPRVAWATILFLAGQGVDLAFHFAATSQAGVAHFAIGHKVALLLEIASVWVAVSSPHFSGYVLPRRILRRDAKDRVVATEAIPRPEATWWERRWAFLAWRKLKGYTNIPESVETHPRRGDDLGDLGDLGDDVPDGWKGLSVFQQWSLVYRKAQYENRLLPPRYHHGQVTTTPFRLLLPRRVWPVQLVGSDNPPNVRIHTFTTWRNSYMYEGLWWLGIWDSRCTPASLLLYLEETKPIDVVRTVTALSVPPQRPAFTSLTDDEAILDAEQQSNEQSRIVLETQQARDELEQCLADVVRALRAFAQCEHYVSPDSYSDPVYTWTRFGRPPVPAEHDDATHLRTEIQHVRESLSCFHVQYGWSHLEVAATRYLQYRFSRSMLLGIPYGTLRDRLERELYSLWSSMYVNVSAPTEARHRIQDLHVFLFQSLQAALHAPSFDDRNFDLMRVIHEFRNLWRPRVTGVARTSDSVSVYTTFHDDRFLRHGRDNPHQIPREDCDAVSFPPEKHMGVLACLRALKRVRLQRIAPISSEDMKPLKPPDAVNLGEEIRLNEALFDAYLWPKGKGPPRLGAARPPVSASGRGAAAAAAAEAALMGSLASNAFHHKLQTSTDVAVTTTEIALSKPSLDEAMLYTQTHTMTESCDYLSTMVLKTELVWYVRLWVAGGSGPAGVRSGSLPISTLLRWYAAPPTSEDDVAHHPCSDTQRRSYVELVLHVLLLFAYGVHDSYTTESSPHSEQVTVRVEQVEAFVNLELECRPLLYRRFLHFMRFVWTAAAIDADFGHCAWTAYHVTTHLNDAAIRVYKRMWIAHAHGAFGSGEAYAHAIRFEKQTNPHYERFLYTTMNQVLRILGDRIYYYPLERVIGHAHDNEPNLNSDGTSVGMFFDWLWDHVFQREPPGIQEQMLELALYFLLAYHAEMESGTPIFAWMRPYLVPTKVHTYRQWIGEWTRTRDLEDDQGPSRQDRAHIRAGMARTVALHSNPPVPVHLYDVWRRIPPMQDTFRQILASRRTVSPRPKPEAHPSSQPRRGTGFSVNRDDGDNDSIGESVTSAAGLQRREQHRSARPNGNHGGAPLAARGTKSGASALPVQHPSLPTTRHKWNLSLNAATHRALHGGGDDDEDGDGQSAMDQFSTMSFNAQMRKHEAAAVLLEQLGFEPNAEGDFSFQAAAHVHSETTPATSDVLDE